MAEYCKECFEEYLYDLKENEEIILSKDNDLCECCGKFKPVVVKIVKKNSLLKTIKRIFGGR